MSGWSVGYNGMRRDLPTVVRQETYGKAWRVGFVLADGIRYSLPIPFGRKQDAKTCCAMIEKQIPNVDQMSLGEFRAAFLGIAGGFQEGIDFLVANCCQW